MKKILIIATLVVLSISTQAQKHITTFLGIPVDGTKSEMVQKLKAKGFTPSTVYDDALEGEFNGRDVLVAVVTYNNRVWRIFVTDRRPSSASQIIIRYNTLCSQFVSNEKYFKISEDIEEYRLPEDENISYEMSVKNKEYGASFYQLPDGVNCSDFKSTLFSEGPENAALKLEQLENNCVWFTIDKVIGGYNLNFYYDNGYNSGNNGEDL